MNYKYTSIPQTPSLKEAQILLPLPIITLIPTGCSAFFSTDPAHFLMLPRHWNDQLPSLACWQKKKNASNYEQGNKTYKYKGQDSGW